MKSNYISVDKLLEKSKGYGGRAYKFVKDLLDADESMVVNNNKLTPEQLKAAGTFFISAIKKSLLKPASNNIELNKKFDPFGVGYRQGINQAILEIEITSKLR